MFSSALMHQVAPGMVTTTEEVGRAMLNAARGKGDKKVVENRDITALAAL